MNWFYVIIPLIVIIIIIGGLLLQVFLFSTRRGPYSKEYEKPPVPGTTDISDITKLKDS